MLPITCNIDQSDRINRSIFGVLILLGVFLGLGYVYYSILGAVMLIEGIIGWCGIPKIIALFKRK